MRIDIHIGIEKTGTTAIQRFLVESRDRLLAERGVLFPRSLGDSLSANLAAACQTREQLDDLRRSRRLVNRAAVDDYRSALFQNLQREIHRHQPRRLLLSCEHFSSRLKAAEEIALLGNFLRGVADDIRVLVYLRRQDDWFISAYSTAVASGRTQPFHYPNPGDEREVLNFDRLLQRWEREFGQAAIKLRRYPVAGGDVVADFCTALDLPPAQRSYRDNAPLNENLIDVLRALNSRVAMLDAEGYPNPERGDLVQALASASLPGSPFNGTGDEEAFYARFEAGNRAVANRYFDCNDLFESPQAREPSAAQPLHREHMLDLIAHLWRYQRAARVVARERELRLCLALQVARGAEEAAQDAAGWLEREYPGSCARWLDAPEQDQELDLPLRRFLQEEAARRS